MTVQQRNRVIILLAAAAILLTAIVYAYIIPAQDARTEAYNKAQKDPLTHDLGSILPYKSDYMGDAPNISQLLYRLPLADVPVSLELDSEHLWVQVHYEASSSDYKEEKLHQALVYNAAAIFSLIRNVNGVEFSFSDVTYRVARMDLMRNWDISSEELLDPETWKNQLQDRLKRPGFLQNCMDCFEIKE
ncbi:DUF4825 domain-containing protein [Gehongia tenuis]|uniref:DUF4825 domain-containing protein n=1 Tax=Gehongia tenuis TaxID=2763655 RepID=A0A926HQX5_9FIRM|nr:DUF4825 domain-containing protein [Gehongia tenuis]MBC8532205.1 DUF4825 domain-containing protein [Gehongia tenuis]